MKHLFLLVTLIITTQQIGVTQHCSESVAYAFLHGNDVKAAFRNGGDMFWTGAGSAQYQVPYTNSSSTSSLFAAALWMGGQDKNGNLHLAAQTYRMSGNDYWAGPINDTTGHPSNLDCQNFDQLWIVNKVAILALLADFADGTIDNTPDNSLLRWPAKGNPHFQGLVGFSLPNKDLAPFFDQNNDGIYNPYEGDYPTYEQNLPNAFANEMLWSIFNDNGNGNIHGASGGTPLNVEVHQMALAFSCSSDSLISRTIFTRHKIISKNPETIHEFKLGLWLDPDLGCHTDDFVGTVPSMNTMYVYNRDNNDDNSCVPGGIGYGHNPPVQAITFLNQPLEYTLYHTDSPSDPKGPPSTALGYHRMLSGQWTNGLPLSQGGTGYSQTNPSTNYVFPDNPNNSGGWSMISESLIGLDPRLVGSMVKDSLVLGESITLDIAYSYHRDLDSSNLQNVNLMYEQVPMVQDFYNNNFSCATITSVAEVKTPKNNKQLIQNDFKIYPNPSTDKIYVELGDQMVESVGLYSLLGQELQQQRKASGTIEFHRNGLLDGIYLIQIQTRQGIATQKVQLTSY
ncbi:MAG: T9SS type A sorting domain-containing protein [Aureispira sp.]|nr:T9SS type A sorting domain-containing protein [Aureispira sp.]